MGNQINNFWYLQILDAQQEILEQIEAGETLNVILGRICELLDELLQSSGAITSIILSDGQTIEQCISHALPSEYTDAVTGLPTGSMVGSCGTAMHLKRHVIASDISTDPRWAIAADIAAKYNLRACWSMPLTNKSQKILGSFAIYHQYVRTPDAEEFALILRFATFCRMAICRWHDLNTQRNLLTALQQSNSRLEAYGKVLPDAVLICDVNTQIYDAFGHLPAIQTQQLIGLQLDVFLSQKTIRKIKHKIYQALNGTPITSLEYSYRNQGKTDYFDARITALDTTPNCAPTKAMLLIRGMTDRKIAERNLKQQAFYDDLTLLANRNKLKDALSQLITHLKEAEFCALLMIDLNNFKRINDALGHAAGDQVLKIVATRLKRLFNSNALLARLGGDEFAILMRRPVNSQFDLLSQSKHNAKKIHQLLSEKISIGSNEFYVSASIGVSIFNKSSNREDVLQQADSAMFQCKRRPNSQYVIFNQALKTQLNNHLKLESEILQAINLRQLCAYFQPQYNMYGKMIGAEALVRWIHPKKGPISPDVFIPYAEKIGLIKQIDMQVFEYACLTYQKLIKNKLIDQTFTLSVNLSAYDFESPNLPLRLKVILDKYNLSATHFVLEMTESILANNLIQTTEQFQRLRQIGFKLSIDDFGTGYSSFNYLDKLPVDELKIDRCFINRMTLSQRGLSIVETIIELSKKLNLHIVAEGIESEDQLNILCAKNISAVQGFYLSKPLNETNFIALALAQSATLSR